MSTIERQNMTFGLGENPTRTASKGHPGSLLGGGDRDGRASRVGTRCVPVRRGPGRELSDRDVGSAGGHLGGNPGGCPGRHESYGENSKSGAK